MYPHSAHYDRKFEGGRGPRDRQRAYPRTAEEDVFEGLKAGLVAELSEKTATRTDCLVLAGCAALPCLAPVLSTVLPEFAAQKEN